MDTLKEWKLYEAGRSYNNQLDPPYNDTVNLNLEFYKGNQWKNVKSNGMPTPVFNMLKRGVQFFVASLMSNKVKINYEPLQFTKTDIDINGDGNPDLDISKMATAEVENLFDKFKMDSKIRKALIDAAVMGDKAFHCYWNVDSKPFGGTQGEYEGEIEAELIDGTNIYLGNANNPEISTRIQPWIIISGRDLVTNLKDEALSYKNSDTEQIKEDSDTFDMSGFNSNLEIEADGTGKAKYIIYYRYDKKTKTIHVSKLTEGVYIYKDIDTGLSNYPIAWLVWEEQKNQYHGRSVCTTMIPNQIVINRMFAMIVYSLMMTAFPKAVYDKDRITSWTNEIGTAIGVSGLMPGDSIKHIAGYLEPGNMSNQVVQALELMIKYTKECFGINDAMMGDVNPEVASGKSIIATVNQAVIPLENVKANLYEWIEDIGKILLDMIGTKYGLRKITVNTDFGRQLIEFDFDQLKDTYLFTKCEVGATSYWSEIAQMETMDNLLNQGKIEIVEYLESIPDDWIPNKVKLLQKVKERMNMDQLIQEQQNMISQMQGQQSAPNMEQFA